MELADKKIWKKTSAIGLGFTCLCLIVCIIQFYSDPAADPFQKGVRIAINFMAVNFFFFLFFNPLAFRIYAIMFYLYGCGNFLDDGNILGAICIALTFIFLSSSGFFRKRKCLRIMTLLVPPVCCIVVQCFHNSLMTFLLSVFNILGAGFIFYLAWLLIIPKIRKASSIKMEKKISAAKYSARDIEFLERVLDGEKYSKIAQLYGVSESTVKAQMIDLYHHLGLCSRTEFLTVCSGCTFVLSEEDIDPSAGQSLS